MRGPRPTRIYSEERTGRRAGSNLSADFSRQTFDREQFDAWREDVTLNASLYRSLGWAHRFYAGTIAWEEVR